MTIQRILSVTVAVSFLTVGNAQAALVVFDFAIPAGSNTTGSDLTGDVNDTSTVDGVTIDATANQGTMFLGAGPDFGINSDGAADEPDAFDDDAGDGTGTAEVMTFFFTFSGSATFVSADFDRITPAGLDIGELAFSGGTTFTFDNTDVDGSDLLAVNEAIVSGQSITLSWVAGNGFGLESITLNVIPEPSAFLLGMVGMLALICGRRRLSRPVR